MEYLRTYILIIIPSSRIEYEPSFVSLFRRMYEIINLALINNNIINTLVISSYICNTKI